MPSSACKTSALRSEEHTSELQSHDNLLCRLLLEKKNLSKKHPPLPAAPPARRPPPLPAPRHARGAARGALPAAAPAGNALFFLKKAAPTELETFSLKLAFPN